MSDRQKLRERERKVAVALFVALTMWPRPRGNSDRAWFMTMARLVIPDLEPEVADTALMLAGQYNDEDVAGIVANADALAAREQSGER